MACKLAEKMAARGITIVSGLALGIDGAAHRGALSAGGRTLAVLGCGLNKVHPRAHISMAQEIVRKGALVSEYPPDTPVNVGQLMARNRIVTGLSRAVVVVEALLNSTGTMDAVVRSLGQRKPCYAIPWEDRPEWGEAAAKLFERGVLPLRNSDEVEMLIASILSRRLT